MFVVLGITLLVFPTGGQAEGSQPEPTKSSFLAGDGLKLIDWSEAIEKDGLRIILGERDFPAQDLPIVVQNVSGETMRFVRLRVVWRDDEGNHIEDPDAWVFPYEIGPGEVGIAYSRSEFGFSYPIDEGHFSVYRLSKEAANASEQRDIQITNASISSSGGVKGSMTNNNPEDVKDLWAHWVCIENSGFVINSGSGNLKQNVLRSKGNGQSAEFSLRLGSDCASGFLLTISATVRP